MPERTIKTSLGTYINEQGNAEFGFKGDKVTVHADHVKRFDEFNVDSGDEVEHPREGVEVINPEPAKKAAPKKADSK